MNEVILPNGWAMATVGDLADYVNGRAFKPTEWKNAGKPIIRIQNLNKDDAKYNFSPENHEEKYLVRNGDLLFAWSASLGAYIWQGGDAWLNQHIFVVHPKKCTTKLFVFYLLEKITAELYAKAHGSGMVHVTKGKFESTEISLPPLNEQHRIVAKIEELFSELDKGIENLNTARAQLKVYRQALLKHAFEGKLTAHWRAERAVTSSKPVIPAQAGIQPLNDMDSRLRGNDGVRGGNDEPLESAAALLKRIQQERAQRYQQQLADWENKSPSVPLLQRGKTTGAAAPSSPPLQKGGRGDLKPKAPKPLPPLTAAELAELPELPEGWVYSYLSDLGDLGRGKSKHRPRNDPRLFGGIYPFVQTGEVKAANRIIRQFSQTYSDFGLQQSKLWPTGTLCITIAANIAETAFLGFDGCFPDSVVGFAAFKEIIAPEYVDFFIQAARTRIEAYAPATAQKNINLETLENLVVPYCSTDEQKQILSILEERFSIVDQLELTLATSLQQAEALRQSILKKAFSGQLVAQDANDEPASVLLARIKAEKATAMAKPHKSRKVAANPAPEKSNVITFPVKLTGISATDLHAGILARAYQHHAQDKSNLVHFGHVKIEKIAHLVEAHLGIDLEREPIKDAAGPNDYPHLMKVESRARKANWFDVRKKKDADAYEFNKKHGFDALLLRTMQALGERADEVDALISLLLPMNKQQVEIVATLYAAWNNLLLLGQSPSDEEIVYEARENWHEAKLKIERKRFFIALGWMRQKGLVPAGNGRHVGKKK